MSRTLPFKLKITPGMIVTAFAFAASFLIYMWFLNSPYFHVIAAWCMENLIALVITVILLKAIGIIWPPLPGGLASIAIIPLVGLHWAYFCDLVGTIIGCSIAYYFGRVHGRQFLAKVFGEEFAAQTDKLKIKKGRELEALFVLRLLGAGVLVEAVSYGAGLIKMSYRKFLVGTVLSHLIIIGPCFYLYSALYDSKEIYLVAASLIITMPILWLVKGRYFEDAVA